MSDRTVQRVLERVAQFGPSAHHASTLRTRTPSARSAANI